MRISSFMRLLGRILLWLVLGLLGLLVVAVAALWLANRHDEPLRPEVARLLHFAPPTAQAMQTNGYFILLGLNAPTGEDARAAGQRFFAMQMKGYDHYRETGGVVSFVREAYPHANISLGPLRCPPEADDCHAHHVQHAPDIRAALATHAHVVARYLSLIDAPAYEEVPLPYIGLDLPYYQDVVAASELVGMQAALQMHEGRPADALQLLQRNTRIHQRMMAGSRTLIGAMIALAMEMRQQRLIASMLRHHPALARDHLPVLQGTLTQTPHDLSPMFEGELRWTLAVMANLRPDMIGPADLLRDSKLWLAMQRPLFRLSYLPHASMNQTWRIRQDWLRLAQLPAHELEAQAAKLEEMAQQEFAWPPPLRNFIGHVLGEMVHATWLPYIERVHDVQGHQRLVRLQMAALRERVPAAQMPAWLADQPPELRDPYTRQPMGWDAATQALVFQGRQPQTQNPERASVYRVPLALTR